MTITDTGIVLSREVWREADKRISFFTQHHGKIDAIAIGAHKIRSKLAGHLEPLREVSLMYADGKNSYKIAQAVTTHPFIPESFRIDIVRSLGELVRLVDRGTVPKVKDEELYELLRAGMISVGESPDEEECLVRSGVALFVVANHLGYAPEFTQCVVCGAQEGFNRFGVQLGGVLCAKCPGEGQMMKYDPAAHMRKSYIYAFLRWRQLV